MSTHPNDCIECEECLYLDYPRQLVAGNRYFAMPAPYLGVTVYRHARLSPNYSVQFFPTTIEGDDNVVLWADYVAYVVKLANSAGEEEKRRREEFPYIQVPDLLTLKAIIERTIEQWNEAYGYSG